MIKIFREGNGFVAIVTPPDLKPRFMGPRVWRSGLAMDPGKLVKELERRGVHQSDAWDAILEVAPDLAPKKLPSRRALHGQEGR